MFRQQLLLIVTFTIQVTPVLSSPLCLLVSGPSKFHSLQTVEGTDCVSFF